MLCTTVVTVLTSSCIQSDTENFDSGLHSVRVISAKEIVISNIPIHFLTLTVGFCKLNFCSLAFWFHALKREPLINLAKSTFASLRHAFLSSLATHILTYTGSSFTSSFHWPPSVLPWLLQPSSFTPTHTKTIIPIWKLPIYDSAIVLHSHNLLILSVLVCLWRVADKCH